MARATLPAGIKQADIEAFLAAKKAEEEKAKKAKAKTKSSKEEGGNYRERKKAATEEFQKEFAPLMLSVCEVTKATGDLAEGDKVEVVWIGANRWLQPLARLNIDGNEGWIDPRKLKLVKKLSDARKASIEAEREAEVNATLTIPATVIKEEVRDDESGGFMVLRYHEFAQPMRLTRKMVSHVGDKDGRSFYEVPAWFIKKTYGQFAVEVLEGRQEEYTKGL